jgi:hypothetical protein
MNSDEEQIRFEKIRRKRHFGMKRARPTKDRMRCSGKIAYKTRQRAESAATTLLKLDTAKFLRTYDCRFCGFFHLTSQVQRTRKRRR